MGKLRYSVPMPTPARRAMSSSEAERSGLGERLARGGHELLVVAQRVGALRALGDRVGLPVGGVVMEGVDKAEGSSAIVRLTEPEAPSETCGGFLRFSLLPRPERSTLLRTPFSGRARRALPAPAAVARPHPALVLGVILATYLMIVLDLSVIITALPSIAQSLTSRPPPHLGPERLRADLRRPAAARRPDGRHPRPPPDVHGRRRALHRRLAARRPRAVAGLAALRARGAGRRRRDRRARRPSPC